MFYVYHFAYVVDKTNKHRGARSNAKTGRIPLDC